MLAGLGAEPCPRPPGMLQALSALSMTGCIKAPGVASKQQLIESELLCDSAPGGTL